MKYFVIVVGLFSLVANANARDQLKIVGSSAVYPFSIYVAEEFSSISRYPSPVVESTGTSGGIKLFCSDNGLNSPDITNASRRMKIKEFNFCQRNGVKNITESIFAYDGIVLAQSNKNQRLNITMYELLLAVVKLVPNENNDALIENPYQYWDQINPSLPRRKISVYGPPVSSGTREAFEEVVLQPQTEELKVYRDAGEKGYRIIRSDGVYIASGENDNVIIKKLTKNVNSLGIFGYRFLTENESMLSGVEINSIPPTAENIASKRYPISRSLYFYTNIDHIKNVPAIKEYTEIFLNIDLVGEEGLLTEIGLIPLTMSEIEQSQKNLARLELVTSASLKLVH